jgi:signal peptidase I
MPAPKGTAELLVEIATAEIGYIEESVPENKTKYQKANQAWCGAFVNWCGKKASVEIPNTVYTPAGADAFKKMKRWYEGEDVTPLPGDIVYFDFPADGVNRISHVGIVVKDNNDGTVTCVEGNTSSDKKGDQRNGGEVCLKIRAFKKKNRNKFKPNMPVAIVGFGRPKFEALSKSADEAKAKA